MIVYVVHYEDDKSLVDSVFTSEAKANSRKIVLRETYNVLARISKIEIDE